jgi:hypothetical protein
MRTVFFLTGVMVAVAFSTFPQATPGMEIEALTPIIFVDEIEPCLSFWADLGFANVGEVEHEGKLGFVMLQRDNAPVMYQSFASIEADIPGLIDRVKGSVTTIYLRLTGLDEVKEQLLAGDVLQPERLTFYGAREIFVRAPCGTTVGFSEMQESR